MKSNTLDINSWINRASKAKSEAHKILARYNSGHSKAIILKDLLVKLDGIPIDIQSYFSESIKCLEYELSRASIVFSWAGFFQVFSEKLFNSYGDEIRKNRNKWQFKDLTELMENYPESQIIDLSKDVGLINKSFLRVLQGQLSTRNRCAHPTLYKPSINSAIGFVDDMISQSIKYL